MAHADNHHTRKLDRDIADMITNLTHQLTGTGKDGSVITLTGSNKGAVLKADLLDDAMEYGRDHEGKKGEDPKLSAYTNSNYQAVNNSIMVDGRCDAEDPGVHIEIVDCIDILEEEDGDDERGKKKDKKKQKKKEKKGSSHEDDEEEDGDDEHEKDGKKKKKDKDKKKKDKKEKEKGSSHEMEHSEEKEDSGNATE